MAKHLHDLKNVEDAYKKLQRIEIRKEYERQGLVYDQKAIDARGGPTVKSNGYYYYEILLKINKLEQQVLSAANERQIQRYKVRIKQLLSTLDLFKQN